MKVISGLTGKEKSEVVTLLESASAQTRTTLGEIRKIDKLCVLFESGETEDVSLEDADYDFLKRRLNEFSAWMPKMRKEIISLADKLGL